MVFAERTGEWGLAPSFFNSRHTIRLGSFSGQRDERTLYVAWPRGHKASYRDLHKPAVRSAWDT